VAFYLRGSRPDRRVFSATQQAKAKRTAVKFTMHVERLGQIFADHARLRGETTILGVGRDLCMLAGAAALYLNYQCKF
jgi:hypothetical protein